MRDSQSCYPKLRKRRDNNYISDYGADGDAETYFEAGRALLLALVRGI